MSSNLPYRLELQFIVIDDNRLMSEQYGQHNGDAHILKQKHCDSLHQIDLDAEYIPSHRTQQFYILFRSRSLRAG